MGKSTHFIGQPLYSQILQLLDKSEFLRISRKRGGERYTKRFNGWVHLVVMLYAVVMRFDSLREITASLPAESRKLGHLGIDFNKILPTPTNAVRRPFLRSFTAIYTRDTVANFPRTAEEAVKNPLG